MSAARNNFKGLLPFKVAGEYTWLDAGALELVLRYIESPHTETLLFRFDGKMALVYVKQCFNSNLPKATVILSANLQ